jgi:hypothetical protein
MTHTSKRKQLKESRNENRGKGRGRDDVEKCVS